MEEALSKVVLYATTIWPFIQEQLDRDNKSFRRALRAFVGLAFHPSILLHCLDGEDKHPCLVMQQEVIPL